MRRAYSAASIKMSETMEQGAVVRQMLDNYKEVRRVFYEEYGGSHYNRDEAYRTPNSFRFGLDPRPFGWGFIELICFFLFRFGNFMLDLYEKIKERRNRRNYGGVSSEDEDLEAALSAPATATATSAGTTTTTSTATSDTISDSKPNCIASIFIAIGDHPCTAQVALFLIGIPILFIRLLSGVSRDCTRRFCRGRLENQLSFQMNSRSSKRMD
mmetsp:Transcript_7116/g.8234  ORF Transcript_7116/g.8234 Transcript_7116/m.8234 type:complete len:213 (-) Transcript_7116:102-740(-)